MAIPGESAMHTLAQTVYLDSELGVPQELPRAGTPLELPLVYDDAAREIKAMARKGLVEIVEEQRGSGSEALIERLRFRRLR